VHFRRKPLVESALKAWSAPRLAQAMQQLAGATLQIRSFRAPVDDLATPVAHRALLSVAQGAKRRS
jgi:DNA polymerase-3 subunit delta